MLQRLCIALVVCLGLGGIAAWGAPPKSGDLPKAIGRGAVGLKLGILNTGAITLTGRMLQRDTAVWVTDHEMDPRAAACGGVHFDVPLAPWFSLLFAGDVYDIRFDQLSERCIDVSTGFKLAFYNRHYRIAWRPGAAVGLGYLADIGFMRPTTYLTLKAFTELVLFPRRGQFAYVFDLGVVGAPSGGNSTVDVTVAPSVYLRAGLLY